MSKRPSSLAILVLVPCLIAPPASADEFTHSAFRVRNLEPSLFAEQAITPQPEIEPLTEILAHSKAPTIRSEAGHRELQTGDLPLEAAALEMRDKFRGALVGVYVGDSFGMPLEQMTREQIVARYGMLTEMIEGRDRAIVGSKERGTLPAGHATDDTAMTMALGRSLLRVGGFSLEDFLEEMAASYDPHWGFSRRTADFLTRIAQGESWQDLVAQETKPAASNGAAIRLAPLALLFHADRTKLEQKILASAQATHRDPLGVIGALLQGFATARALDYSLGHPLDPIAFVDSLCGDVRHWGRLISQAQRRPTYTSISWRPFAACSKERSPPPPKRPSRLSVTDLMLWHP